MHNIQYEADRTLKAYAVCTWKCSGNWDLRSYRRTDQYSWTNYVSSRRLQLLGRPTATRYCVLLLGLQVPVTSDTSRNCQGQGFDIAVVCCEKAFPKFDIPPVVIRYDKTKSSCRNIFFIIPIAVKLRVEIRLHQLIALCEGQRRFPFGY